MKNRTNASYQINVFNEAVVDYFGNPFIVYHNLETDAYGNRVTILTSSEGMDYRMVHHSKPHHKIQRAAIYAGRNRYIRVRWFYSESPNDAENDNYIEAYRIGIRWVKKENNEVELYEISGEDSKIDSMETDYPNLIETLDLVEKYQPYRFILTILSYVCSRPELWDSKETEIRSVFNYTYRPSNQNICEPQNDMKDLISKINS